MRKGGVERGDPWRPATVRRTPPHQEQDQEINGSLGPGLPLSPTTTPPPLLTLPRLLWRYQGENPPR